MAADDGALLMDAVHLAAINTITDLRTWSGLTDIAWDAVNSRLGTVPSLVVWAYMPPAAVREALRAARIVVPPEGEEGEDGHIPQTTRQLTPVETTQVGLMLQGAQLKFGLTVVNPLVEEGGTPVFVPAPPVVNTGTAGNEGKRKIKCNQVLDQADEAEVPELGQKEIDFYYARLSRVKGGPVRPEAEPSSDQISAMKVRVMELGLPPYADFAVFVNFQHRFSKTLKFLNHILQPDGTFKAIEVPGPPNYDQWLSSWRVFENTLLMLVNEVSPTVSFPIVTQSALEEYKDSFRDMVVNYPEAWHLLVTAEDRCRCEHFPTLRRLWEDKHTKGQAPDFVIEQPWDFVFRAAARDRNYWDKNVREPALLFRTSSGRKKEQPGGTGSGTDQTGEGTADSPRKKKGKSQRERLKKQLAKMREEKSRTDNPGPGDKPGGGGRGPKRDGKGRFLTDRQGKQICFGFNNGDCKPPCAKGMVHVCQVCLGTHPAKQCRKGPNN